jgi:uncharacterized protein
MPALAEPATASSTVDQLATALGPVERRETHGSWVLLTRDRAYKIKKPIVLDFLDYGSLERRRAMCRAEVELNRRAAPDVYLGVRAVVPAVRGVALAEDGAPDAIEYVVEMRRFDEQRTLAASLARDDVTSETVAQIGRAVAGFHAGCPVMRDRNGAEPVRRVIDDNFASLFTLLGDDAGAHARLARAQRFAVAFLAARGPQLDDRAAAGRMLDGHGDLRAEHVVLDSPLEIVDAIEFDPGLRQVDAGMDLAFLVMDLHARGRADLAGGLVRAYRRAGGDPGDDALLAFFAAYRAQVRAKVALVRAAQLDPEPAAATRREASELLSLADRLAWRARAPLVLAIAGASASGKTTLASALAATSGLPHLNSDVVRKRRYGIAPTARAPQALYGAAENAATYHELGRLAAATPGGVIVDATFRCRSERDAFRQGLGPNDADVVFVECRVPAGVLAARATARLVQADRVSDATPALALDQFRAFEPLDEVAAGAHLLIRADQDPARLAADVADGLDRRLCGSPEARDRGFP